MYEPYIISALMSAKVLIVVGTSPENMNAQWVKNEWSRFQWLQKNEKKMIGKTDRRPDPVHAENTVQISAEQVLNQMTVWLYTGEYQAVLDKYEELKKTGRFLDEPQLHLNALCARKKAADIEQLSKAGVDLGKEPLFKLALKMCKDPDERKRLMELQSSIKKPQEKTAAPPPKKPELTPAEWFKRAKEIEKAGKINEAINAYKIAADKGYAPAQNNLGVIFETGGFGVPMRRPAAVSWYEKAAMQGHANGQYNYARCKEHGRGTAKDLQGAVLWYEKAAKQGHVQAQYNLGVCLAKGTGTAKDPEAAKVWFKKAADQGIAEAAHNLSCLNSQGG